MRLLVYEGVRVEFYPTSDVASSSASSHDRSNASGAEQSRLDAFYGSEEYLASRTGPVAIKKETAVPTELPEVVNLARDYDRWDHYEAPPPLED